MENYLNVSEFISLIWVYTNFFGKGNDICLLTQSAFTRIIIVIEETDFQLGYKKKSLPWVWEGVHFLI